MTDLLTIRTDKEVADAAACQGGKDAHDAALARAKQADEDAAAAAAALDAARTRAAKERAAAAAAITPPGSSCSATGPHTAPTDLHAVMLLHKAAALLNLHAQEVAVHNI
jgi:hypothetical protein